MKFTEKTNRSTRPVVLIMRSIHQDPELIIDFQSHLKIQSRRLVNVGAEQYA